MPDFGDGSPRENYGAVDPYAPSVENGQITPEQWAEYQRKRKRAAILGVLGTVGGMAGGGLLNYALGGGGAAANSALPAVEGGAPWAVTPYATTATMSGTGLGAAGAATGAAGAAAGASKGILGGLTARDLAALGLSGASMLGSALSDKPDMNPTTQTSDPNLAKLIATMQGRLNQSEPLYGSILDMANGLLPTQYQKGGGGRM